MTKRIIKVLILLLTISSRISFAQYHELRVNLGLSSYNGDLTPSNQPINSNVHFSTSIDYSYHISNFFSLRVGGLYGKVSGSDQDFPKKSDQRLRNLSFQSVIGELSCLSVFNFPRFKKTNSKNKYTFYLFGGFAAFYYSPKTRYKNDWIILRDLGTEGQGLPEYPNRQKYSLWNIAIPFGGGVKWAASKRINISLEFGARKTFTDYLDDVSKTYVSSQLLETYNGALARDLANRSYDFEGNQIDRTGQIRGGKSKDWYFISSIGISINIGGKESIKELEYSSNKWM